MLTLDTIRAIVSDVKFRDWSIRVLPKADGFLLQVVFMAPDCENGAPTEQHGRKWYVSSHACKSEVVQTAYAAVQRAILHEVAEDFLYRGRRIYNPHQDVEELVTLADLGKEEVRTGPTFAAPREPAKPYYGNRFNR
jgi:hypothetical protein